MSVRDIDRGLKGILSELNRAKKLEVAIGLLEGSVNDGESIAQYAAYNEFGTEDIPSRPFMAMSFDENKQAINKDFETQSRALVAGKRTANQCLTIIGQKHADRVKTVITGRDITPRLAASTVKAKKGSTKTLVDSGAMVNAVQISVRGRT